MFEAAVNVGDRVQTRLGAGIIKSIKPEVHWVGGDPVRESLVVVQMDDRPPSAMRSVFYASQVKPEGDGDPED